MSIASLGLGLGGNARGLILWTVNSGLHAVY